MIVCNHCKKEAPRMETKRRDTTGYGKGEETVFIDICDECLRDKIQHFLNTSKSGETVNTLISLLS